MSEELLNAAAKRFGRDPLTVAKCAHCFKAFSGEFLPGWRCPDCLGAGVVCNLCRDALEECECNGVLNPCEGCGRVPAACNCNRKESQ